MRTVTSKDGTNIAYDRSGRGPAVILVDGALAHRAWVTERPSLDELLAQRLTVIHHDRRGRGESSDTPPFAVEREIEDIEALIDAAGGRVFLFGISSGAALAMEAAVELGEKVAKLAMYEAPYNSEESARQAWRQYRRQLASVLAEGRRDEALLLFMRLVGLPPDQVDAVSQHPLWPMWAAAAPTLVYDAAVLGEEAAVPLERAAQVAAPALVMDGGASYPFMHTSASALAQAMPNARHLTLDGQTHEVAAAVIAPVLLEFFGSDGRSER